MTTLVDMDEIHTLEYKNTTLHVEEDQEPAHDPEQLEEDQEPAQDPEQPEEDVERMKSEASRGQGPQQVVLAMGST
jgi:hypothetical protein